MEWLIGFLVLIGVAAAAAAGFFAGRLTAAPDDRPPAPEPVPPMTEAEKRKQRELQNFLQYDGFMQS